MKLVLFFSGLLVLFSVLYKSEAQKPASIYKKCYKAKTCVHNNHEKCGISGNSQRRRFLDSCDIEEFNCLYDRDFRKISMDVCNDLPSLYAREGKERVDNGDQLLRNSPDKLENENNPNKLNMGHNSIEYADFSIPAQPQNLDQAKGADGKEFLRGGQMKMAGYNGTKTLRGEIYNDTNIHGKKTKKPFNVSKIPVKMAKLVKYNTTMEDKTLRQRKE